MKLPGSNKMKKLYAGIATQNYCCYLAGRFDESVKKPELSLKQFCKDVEKISKNGQLLFRERLKNGNVQGTLEEEDS